MSTLAEVRLWGRTIGAVVLEDGQDVAAFEYAPAFLGSGIEVSPLAMPLGPRVYSFGTLPTGTFHGLPGLLADSLPDRFGNALIDAWLVTQGRSPDSFNAVERLCYTGTRGMGALEYAPVIGPRPRQSSRLRIDRLVELASQVLRARDGLRGSFAEVGKAGALRDILRVGTSAGGARAKAVITWHPETNEVRSGQLPADEGFGYWLLKFDGVSNNRDKELADPQGFGVIEYAYYRMATDCGIQMSECRLFEEGGRRHFMTRRFDRLPDGGKLHMQSLGAMAHLDFNQAGVHSYEQALLVLRRLGCEPAEIEQLFRRMVFNIVARNQDDHVKDIAFLMDRAGMWSLAPAFDMTYSYQPEGKRTSSHQMTVNGKRDDFALADLEACAEAVSMKRGRAKTILAEVRAVVGRWRDYADDARVAPAQRDQTQATLRLESWGQ